VYDGEKPILEYNSGGGLAGWNLYGKGIDEIIERGAYGSDNAWHWYFLQQDRNGNVTHLTNYGTTVTAVEKYRYDVFGKPTIYNSSNTQLSASAYNNRFLFTGREYAATFGFYEYRARSYHPGLGRSMSEDPKLFDADDYNLFRYCHNDPIDFTDPMGLETNWGGEGPQNPQNQAAVARYAEMRDYNKIMAEAQWRNSDAIAAGMAGYQAWSALRGLHMAQISLQDNRQSRLGIRTGVKDNDSGDFQLLGQLDGPQLLKLRGEPVWDPYTRRMVLAPAGFNLSENISAAQKMWGSTWVNKILISPNQRGWDYKQIGPFRDLGNINFGATGRANGWPGGALLKGGELFKVYQGTSSPTENARDQFMIQTGINYYDTGGR
jgi:RHS repeat-associated protein